MFWAAILVSYIKDIYKVNGNVISRLFLYMERVLYDKNLETGLIHISLIFEKLSRLCIVNELAISIEN